LKGHLGDDGIDFRVARLEDLDAEMSQICDRTRELVVIDTATDSTVKESCLVANWESRTRVMSGVDGLAWISGWSPRRSQHFSLERLR